MSDEEKKDQESFGPDDECVIVVEDSRPNRVILSTTLRDFGYKVIEAEDGQQAWEKVTGEDSPKLVAVFSDIIMPKLDGIELLRKIRGDEKYKDIPFFIVSAVTDVNYIKEASGLKVNGYLLKPISRDKILQKLKQFFPDNKKLKYL